MKGEFESAVSKTEKEWKYRVIIKVLPKGLYFSNAVGYYYNKAQILLYLYTVQAWQLKTWQLSWCLFKETIIKKAFFASNERLAVSIISILKSGLVEPSNFPWP